MNRHLLITAPLAFLVSTILGTQAYSQAGGQLQTLYQLDGPDQSSVFGTSVSGVGDVNGDGFDDFIVGAPRADIGAYVEAGTVQVYSGATGIVLYQFDGSSNYDNVGIAVSGAGDINADGFSDFMFAQSYGDKIFVHSGWNGALLHQFSVDVDWGAGISGAGDVNGDGYDDVIFGNSFGGSSYEGLAKVFSGLDGSLLYFFSGEANNEHMGRSVSGAGDVNGDGFDDLLIGAHRKYLGGLASVGSAYVYSGESGDLLYRFDGSSYAEELGFSVSEAGDVNGDGFSDVIVGAHGAIDPTSFYRVGAAFVYSGIDGSLIQQHYGGTTGSSFGRSVSGAGEINGDGNADYTVGGFYDRGTSTVFAYSGATGNLLFGAVESSSRFGWALASAGDVNGDGYSDVIVGAPETSGGFPARGSAYVYSFNAIIHSNAYEISASTGGDITLDLDFPDSAYADQYKILISSSGMGPTNYGVDIPLTQDSLVVETFQGHYPFPLHSGLQGILDSSGNALATISFPSGVPSGVIGNTYWLAAIASKVGQLPEFSSIAVPIKVNP